MIKKYQDYQTIQIVHARTPPLKNPNIIIAKFPKIDLGPPPPPQLEKFSECLFSRLLNNDKVKT